MEKQMIKQGDLGKGASAEPLSKTIFQTNNQVHKDIQPTQLPVAVAVANYGGNHK